MSGVGGVTPEFPENFDLGNSETLFQTRKSL